MKSRLYTKLIYLIILTLSFFICLELAIISCCQSMAIWMGGADWLLPALVCSKYVQKSHCEKKAVYGESFNCQDIA